MSEKGFGIKKGPCFNISQTSNGFSGHFHYSGIWGLNLLQVSSRLFLEGFNRVHGTPLGGVYLGVSQLQ